MTDNQKSLHDWFHIQSINETTWAIDDHGNDVIYLIKGEETCLLLDTGWGIGDLPALVTSLTPLPVIVVNSHAHPDHAFGNSAFAEVSVHKDDEIFLHEMGSPKALEWFAQNVFPEIFPGNEMTIKTTPISDSLITIEDGHIFDLGQRTLEVISLPGHTPGSICLLDRQQRWLFTGDSILTGGPIWLHLPESLPLQEYHRNLQRLQTYADAFDGILPGHADLQALPLSKSLLDELVNGIPQILTGELVGYEEHTFAGDGLRCDFSTTGVLYRPDQLIAGVSK